MQRRFFLLGALAAISGCTGPLPPSVELVPVGEGPPVSSVPPSRNVSFPGYGPGEIHVFPDEYALYWTLPNGRARRYTVGIGRPGQYISGTYRVRDKREWPRWTPTANMIRREPELYAQHAAGMPGGPDNPLGARALYLYRSNGTDSLLRIHGTHDVRGLGQQISNGCVRMDNNQVTQLYEDVPFGTKVVLHPI